MDKSEGNSALPVSPANYVLHEDAELVALVRKRGLGWKVALGALLDRHRAWIFNFCLMRLGNHHDAQDATQEVVIRVCNAIGRFEGRSAFRTWLYRICENQCRTFAVRRARYVQVEHIEALIDLGRNDLALPQSDAVSDKQTVSVILDSVSPQAREVLQLRFFEDRSLDDIAGSLDISLSAAKMRLYRALDQFRAYYLELVGLPHVT
ncbi:MAG: sigma-70 family RNA polymerase sigma factor [Gammaproteobacteria bacterium]|jgi:RNA polymerase sigma-70 factor (ECF subfamily)